MSKRGDKRRKKREQRRRPSVLVRWSQLGPVRIEQSGRDIVTSVDPEHPAYADWLASRNEMLEELPKEIVKLREELKRELDDFDAFDVVADLWITNVPKNPETYVEWREKGQLVIPEMAAALLIQRPTRTGKSPGSWFAREVSSMQEKIKTLLHFEGLRIASGAKVAGTDPVYEEIRARSRSHRLGVRGVSYVWQEQATTMELCGDGQLGVELGALLGFSAEDAFRLADSVTEIGLDRLATRMLAARKYADELAAEVARVRAGGQPDTQRAKEEQTIVDSLVPLKKKQAERRIKYFAASWASYATGMTFAFTVDELASHAGVSKETVESFLRTFSIGFGLSLEDGREPSVEDLRDTPILDDGEGNFLCCSPHNLHWAIRPAFEDATQSAGTARGTIWSRYERHRRRVVERRAVAAIEGALRATWADAGVHYEVTDDGGEIKRPELDGVVRRDSAVFLIEAKASSMRPSARRGAPAALRDWLKDEVGKAGRQARAARDALFEGPEPERSVLCDERGTPLGRDLDGVTEVVELVVVLEDLPFIAPVTWQMADAGFLPADESPILISLHELEIICDISDRPAEFVQYFLRRRRLNRQRRASAIDELDFYMHYLKQGLYWDDPDEDDAPEAAAPVRLLSFTDELDAYYMYSRGERQTPAPKPTKRHHRDVAKVLDLLENQDQPGSLSVALALLDLDVRARERVVGDMRRLKTLAAGGRTERDRSYFGPGFGMTVMAVPPTQEGTLPDRLREYTYLKKYQTKADSWVGFGVFEGPPELFQVAVIWSAPWEYDDELERAVATLPSYGYEGERFDGRRQRS